MANDLANEVARLLRAYTDEVEQDLNKVFDEVGREGVEMVTEASPVRYGKYKKGWNLKKEKNKRIIHNATDWRRTHLLEKGHALVNGGRSKAYPHIKKAEEFVKEQVVKRVEERLAKS